MALPFARQQYRGPATDKATILRPCYWQEHSICKTAIVWSCCWQNHNVVVLLLARPEYWQEHNTMNLIVARPQYCGRVPFVLLSWSVHVPVAFLQPSCPRLSLRRKGTCRKYQKVIWSEYHAQQIHIKQNNRRRTVSPVQSHGAQDQNDINLSNQPLNS